MPTYQPRRLLPDDRPGPWSDPVAIDYTQRDVLLYAAGIGCTALSQVYEADRRFSVFPTFAIRWGGMGLHLDPAIVPGAPGPLMIDAERELHRLAPLPLTGPVGARSRLLAVHPRPKGAAFAEVETEVIDGDGRVCVRMVSGSFRRGIARLGDIAPFEGAGASRSVKIEVPDRAPAQELTVAIPTNQAIVYRLSGDFNPLHIDPDAAAFGGFDRPILHGLCTYGYCAHMLVGALCAGDAGRFSSLRMRFSSPVFPGDSLQLRLWHDTERRVVFEARAADRVVVSNAFFTWR